MSGTPDQAFNKQFSQQLNRRALHYLARYAASRAKLSTYLTRKFTEKYQHDLPEAFDSLLKACLDRLEALAYLDDAAYGRGRIRSYQAKSYSLSTIRQKLRQDGLQQDTIDDLLENTIETELETDEVLARRFAQKHKLGAWQITPLPTDPIMRQKLYQKHLAKLARRGFSLSVARHALESSDDGENNDDGEYDGA
ncbi:MAG: regulatory protein RecX [Alphaproteobacteria bacterium]